MRELNKENRTKTTLENIQWCDVQLADTLLGSYGICGWVLFVYVLSESDAETTKTTMTLSPVATCVHVPALVSSVHWKTFSISDNRYGLPYFGLSSRCFLGSNDAEFHRLCNISQQIDRNESMTMKPVQIGDIQINRMLQSKSYIDDFKNGIQHKIRKFNTTRGTCL